MQIPGLAQPISLQLTNQLAGATTSNQQPTGLLVSVPVSNASQVQSQLQSVSSPMPVTLQPTTQTVVLTTAGQQNQGSMLSLPIG